MVRNIYSVKTLGFEVKDVDSQTRRVKVALSRFDNVDSDGDVIRMGAFAKSIKERGPDSASNRKIAFLRYHDWEHPVGTWQTLEETNEHLVGVGDLGRSTKGNDALLDYQDGMIKEHSIGFNYIEDKMQMIDMGGKDVFEISEVMLWEGSGVTFGANSLTPTLDVSKGEHIDMLAKVNTEMECIVKALKNGKGTDDRLHEMEMRLLVCQQKYNSLINIKPSVKALEDGEPGSVEDDHTNNNSFYKFL